MKKKILSLILAMAMVIGMIPIGMLTAMAEGSAISYYCWNEEKGLVEEVTEELTLSEVTSSTVELSTGWYIVRGDVTVESRIAVSGAVHLILADGCHLSTYGITVNKNNSLNIYAQSTGNNMGVLTASHIDSETQYSLDFGCAGIGGAGDDNDSGTIIIHGGNITAEGGQYAAGIGGGEDESADVTIYGGDINAFGGTNSDGFSGAGIGSGYTQGVKKDGESVYDGTAGTITICGGNINAVGNKAAGDKTEGCAAGIGGGYGSDGGTITISGGNIEAHGGHLAAGIGAARDMPCGNITISGGVIKAFGGEFNVPDIGDGLNEKSNGTVTVTGGYIDGDIAAKTVNLPEGEPTKWTDDTWHVGYVKFPALESTCKQAGHLEYYKDNYSGKYHSDFPFTDENLIGGENDVEVWLSEGNSGFLPLAEHMWEYTNSTTHTCSVCGLIGEHTETDGDGMCDSCAKPMYYYEYNEELKEFEAKKIPAGAVEVDCEEDLFISQDSPYNYNFYQDWYVITKSFSLTKRRSEAFYYFDFDREIHIILANGVTLNATMGIRVCNPLTIYAMSLDESKMGTIKATAINMGEAGIGGGLDEGGQFGYNSYACDDITIHGGRFEVTGATGGAGIGGGYLSTDIDDQPCGDITIYGGNFNVKGGKNAPAIGVGLKSYAYSTDITIFGGSFKLEAGAGCGAALGTGGEHDAENLIKGVETDKYGKQYYTYYFPSSIMGDITINGGYFYDIDGNDGGAAIGTGARGKCGNITINGGWLQQMEGNSDYYPYNDKKHGAAAIGSGYFGECGDITINNGFLHRIYTTTAAPAIGSGCGASCGDITINNGILSQIIGGFDSVAIGAGRNHNEQYSDWPSKVGTCGKITINGGYIEPVGGGIYQLPEKVTDSASFTGNVEFGPNVVTKNVTHVKYQNEPNRTVTYVGSKKAATCTEAGHTELYCVAAHHTGHTDRDVNIVDGVKYYSSIESTAYDSKIRVYNVYGNVIGDENALATWLETPVVEGGGMIPALGHTDSNGDNTCDICKEIIDKTKSAYTGVSLTLDSNIFLNFYMHLPDDARQSGTMEFDIGGRIVNSNDIKFKTNEKGAYFACPINALEMATTVTATFTYGTETYTQTYSVKQYIEEIVNNPDKYGEKAVALAKKIANYGYYAQEYLASIHTNVTIGENGYTAIEKYENVDIDVSIAKKALGGYSLEVTGTSDNLSLYGSTVYFDSATALNYYVKVADGVQPTATCDGKTVIVTEYKGYTPTANEKVYIVSVKGITATELADTITVTVNEKLTITGSVFAYCKAVMNKDGQTDAAKNAMAAFYEYYLAAAAYAATQE